MDPRAQRATDQYEAALSAGASSATLQGLEKAKKSVLDLIREENRDKATERRFDLQEQRMDQQQENFTASLGIRQQQADTATTRADTASQRRAATEERMTTIINSQEKLLGRLGNSPPRLRNATPEQQEAANKEWEEDRKEAMDLIRDARRELRKNFQEEPPQPRNPGDNTQTTRPPLNSFVR
jgi:hypothetical protein